MTTPTDIPIESVLKRFYASVCHKPYYLTKQDELSPKYKASKAYAVDYSVVHSRLQNGWTTAAIISKLGEARAAGIKASFISEVIPLRPPIGEKETGDLLLATEVYRHPEIRIVTRASVATSEHTAPRIKICRVASYTLGDLVNYFIKVLKPDVPRDEVKRAVRFMLSGGVHLDDMLYGIDRWGEDNDGPPHEDLYALRRYSREAREERDYLDTLCKKTGRGESPGV